MSEKLQAATIGELVATDVRAAGVFERFGIDFCCGGRQSLAEACRAVAADPDAVSRALEAMPEAARPDDDVTQWTVSQLIDHIVSTHHSYVRSALPAIGSHLAKTKEAHGARHPELDVVAGHFEQVSRDLGQHMMKEEMVLFPYVRELGLASRGASIRSPFGTVENPIRMMEHEHREAADEMRIIRELTSGYATPADGCATYALCMSELEQFELDLHRHVHLENNVLFPKAVELEISHSRD